MILHEVLIHLIEKYMDTKTKKPKKQSVFLKMIEDKKAISECIRMGGDLNKLAKERGLKFAKPL